MTEEVKEFIAKAKPRTHKTFFELYVINSEKEYDGFWGMNGHNKIVLIGRSKGCEDYELITDFSDAISILDGSLNIDISKENGIVRMFSHQGFTLFGPAVSTVIFEREKTK